MAFDGSQEMVKRARQILRYPAKYMLFDDMDFDQEFKDVWAAASLLHVPPYQLSDIFSKIH